MLSFFFMTPINIICVFELFFSQILIDALYNVSIFIIRDLEIIIIRQVNKKSHKS